MRLTGLLVLMLAGSAAFANPIFVATVPFYKEGAIVTITAERESAKVAGRFQYRAARPRVASPGSAEFSLEVPVFVPRDGYGPPSQKEMWSSHSNPQKSLGLAVDLQYSTGGPFQTVRSCRVEIASQLSASLPAGLDSSADAVMCRERVTVNLRYAAEGVRLDLDYRQYYVRARGSSRMHFIYLPLFENRTGTPVDTAGRPDDFLVEIRAVPGVTLQLVSKNKVVATSIGLLRVAPVHLEPIIVEVR